MEVSAKTGENVELVRLVIIIMIYESPTSIRNHCHLIL